MIIIIIIIINRSYSSTCVFHTVENKYILYISVCPLLTYTIGVRVSRITDFSSKNLVSKYFNAEIVHKFLSESFKFMLNLEWGGFLLNKVFLLCFFISYTRTHVLHVVFVLLAEAEK